ncbi:hypothetical protein A9Q87_11550 [Flavobacteriales bacterium 34_180_T64]|nr:hypothetical protein A9Q87_11550 [Flavobacteriales bacterium 34_180_T64]
MGKFKIILIFALISIFSIPTTIAQTVPQGMKYQAIARTSDGDLIKEKPISMMITLQSNDASKTVHYIEIHDTTTNLLGLFSLTIGEGEVFKGEFNKIPWSTEDIWMEIAIKSDDGDYKTLSITKLLAVPYAFHAATASKLTNGIVQKDGVPANVWSLKGNSNSDALVDKLGTTDSTDLVIVTDNIERLRITADGQIITGDGKFTIGGNLEVQGDSTRINKDLYVGRNVVLNFDDGFDPRGETINHGKFTAKDSLIVEGYSLFKSDVTLDKNLNVLDSTISRSLLVKDELADGGFLATFENIDTGQGDGINIKLGKTHPGWDGSAYINATNPVAEYFDINIQNVRDAVTGANAFTFTDALELIPAVLIAGTACGLLEQLVEELNDAIGLPYLIELPALCVTVDYEVGEVTVCVPGFGSPTELFNVPAIPTDFCPDIPSLSMPNISFVNVTNSLTNDNHYIEFTDKDNRSLGSVRAVSITEWGNNYFNGVWLSGFIQKSVGIDPLDAITGIVNVASTIADDYNKIGVEYTSGNGDYAEWLERLNPNEFISKGDIVGVIGGKITKNLENAEQIMAVSEKPIMLGNIPEKSKEFLGNNVAFMGQIPVKVIGKVSSGDYIIAYSDVPGYGIAKSPSKVTIEDTKYIVGRSWQTNLESGPKMVNTVIGVHNGDYLKIIKKFQSEFKNAVERLDNLEAKVDAIVNKDIALTSNE